MGHKKRSKCKRRGRKSKGTRPTYSKNKPIKKKTTKKKCELNVTDENKSICRPILPPNKKENIIISVEFIEKLTEEIPKYKNKDHKDKEPNTRVSSELHAKDIINDLCSFKNLKVRLQNVPVYHVQTATRNHPVSIQNIQWKLFNKESLRLVTYIKYPERGPKSAMLLANHGFVYTGEGNDNDDRVTCYSCCSTKQDWLLLDDVAEIHRQMSPGCSMVTNINSDNIPMSMDVVTNFDNMLENAEKILPFYDEKVKENNTPLPLHSQLHNFNNSENQNIGNRNYQQRLNQTDGNIRTQGDVMEIESDSVPSINRESITNRSQNVGVLNPQLQNAQTKQLSLGSPNRISSQTPTIPAAVSSLSVSENRNLTTGNLIEAQHLNLQPDSNSDIQSLNMASQEQISPFIEVQISLPKSIPSKPHENRENSDQTSANLTSQVPSISSRSLYPNSPTIATTGVVDTSRQTEPSQQPAPTNTESAAPTSSNPDATPQLTTVNTNSAATNKPGKRNPTYSELGIITERPKRPEYAVKLKRKETFSSWPRNHRLTEDELVDAGFYFAGYGDCARCFYCGGGLRNWEDEDDVYVEHARWFPKCAFIRQRMGQVFVDQVQKLNKDRDQISFSLVLSTLKETSSTFQLESNDEPLKRDAAVKVVVEMGYNMLDAIAAAKFVKEKYTIISADAILEKLQADQRPRDQTKAPRPTNTGASSNDAKHLETLRTIKEQNNQLRQQTVCKICMDQEVAVVFLPCGHLVSCNDCASAMRDCPVCRKTVKGTVRAFIS
ncbi:uncharacterized protein LOC131943882 isoform X2 [Physella acuta]|uniref:uncharacterized protein LOC131943882 isoform X2 n=1 Tax=Physella acuta TaxID=109671 RepID=UPI0027DCC0E1|nr:uncharacterized protein LOC131943882 isoform X2 [Physella acuta]